MRIPTGALDVDILLAPVMNSDCNKWVTWSPYSKLKRQSMFLHKIENISRKYLATHSIKP